MTLHLPIWAFKNHALCWSRYRDANPVPTSPLADDVAIAPLGPAVLNMFAYPGFIVKEENNLKVVKYPLTMHDAVACPWLINRLASRWCSIIHATVMRVMYIMTSANSIWESVHLWDRRPCSW